MQIISLLPLYISLTKQNQRLSLGVLIEAKELSLTNLSLSLNILELKNEVELGSFVSRV